MTKWNPRIKTRMIVLFYLVFLCYGLLGLRLVRVQALERNKLQTIATNQHIGEVRVAALRGSILDARDQLLATSIALPSVAANPQQVQDKDGTAYLLSEILHASPNDIYSLLTLPGTFTWVGRKVPIEAASKIESLNIPGVFILHESSGRRFYPKGRLASHIIGYTGIDDNGLEGLEARYDNILKGTDGMLEAEMDRDGRVIPDGWEHLRPAKPGHNLELTIDETVQYICERELRKQVAKFHASSGSVLVLDVKSGDILGMASVPDYDLSKASEAPPEARRARCITDSYEPGSTFKVFIASAALDSGIPPDRQFPCGSTITVGGWTLHNAEGDVPPGSADIKTDVTFSYNTGTAQVGLYMGKKKVYEYLKRFGLFARTGIDLPGETDGIVQPYKDWAPITLATTCFGQGIAVTPLQIGDAMEAIANNGVEMRPRIVKAIVDSEGHVVKAFPPVVRARPVRPETALLMRDILRNVVANGTGKLADIQGYPCCGKTGTANIAENGVYGDGYIASFLGFLPYQDPRIVILVKIDRPKGQKWGGTVAAPVFHNVGRDIMRHLGIPPLPPPEPKPTPSKAGKH
ncbi:MAG: peptidoglycan D,D-transpeptidase FtsI family protein [Candidatus Xenobia bacterium]